MAINPNNLATTATLTFSDEFNTTTLDSSTWGTGYPWGAANGSTNTANGESGWYINANYAPTSQLDTYTVHDGVLDIKEAPASAATQALINGYDFTSGMVNTQQSFSQTYGYFEMRADIPAGEGMWPAFWLLPTSGGWPPELDVMEVVGTAPDALVTTVHWDANGHQMVNRATNVPGLSSGGMHTYGVDWQADTITWYLDGKAVFEADTPADMHDPMYMLANLATGGAWAGEPNGSTNHMLIDYIRVYSEMPGGGTPPPTETDPATTPTTPVTPTDPVVTPVVDTPTTPTVPVTTPTPVSPDTPTDPVTTPTTEPGTDHITDLTWTADPTRTVTGHGQNDRLWGSSANELIDGGHGADTTRGGGGDDTYIVDNAGDRVIEWNNRGDDLVRTTLTEYSLPKNVENLQLNGSGPQTGIGNAGDNNIVASAWNEADLRGGDGNDTLVSKHGAATMTGGHGADSFRFDELPSQAGHVTDFKSGSDKLDLRSLLTGAGYHGTDPLADHTLTLTANGSGGTDVSFDADGTGGHAAVPLTTLDHILPNQLHQADWMFA
ncbi:family 16 glycosylhydrolase [Methylobacterium sp. 77]|uniref:family 16 glycosylhydrolase n=1 Tax=Methylobacterium sp. 77 TaxID=1101192 RepID=UPI0003648271|nr:family 16 glycosylhydrolase [Methylobacterium sp. 77]